MVRGLWLTRRVDLRSPPRIRHHKVVKFDPQQSNSDGGDGTEHEPNVATDPNDVVTFEKLISHCARKLYGAASQN